MPYYLFKRNRVGFTEQLGEHAKFIDASKEAKKLRKDLDAVSGDTIRVVFGETSLQAEELLNEVREAPVGDVDE